MKEPDESLEREGYYHSNSLDKCQKCFTTLVERNDIGGHVYLVCPVCNWIDRQNYEM